MRKRQLRNLGRDGRRTIRSPPESVNRAHPPPKDTVRLDERHSPKSTKSPYRRAGPRIGRRIRASLHAIPRFDVAAALPTIIPSSLAHHANGRARRADAGPGVHADRETAQPHRRPAMDADDTDAQSSPPELGAGAHVRDRQHRHQFRASAGSVRGAACPAAIRLRERSAWPMLRRDWCEDEPRHLDAE